MILLQALFRWFHVLAGIMWIGHLWFFNFVNAQVAKSYDADSKKKVVPELMPRALYWFRWGAAYTFITGILLLGMIFYAGGSTLLPDDSKLGAGVGSAIGLAVLIVGFAVYDLLWKSALGKNEKVAGAISYVLVVAIAFGLGQIFTGRAMFIHIGALFGTIMAGNVWMRIWPAQKKIIAGIKGTAPAPDASVAAMAGLRSKHNTYMSVPLVFLMISNHYQNIPLTDTLDVGYSNPSVGFVMIALFVAAGWGITKRLYTKSASPVTKEIGDTAAPAAAPTGT